MHQINLSPPEEAIDGTLLPDLVSAYLRAKRLEVGAVTLDGYRHSLNLFCNWWEMAGPRFGCQLSPRALRRYADWLQTDYRTVHGDLLTISGQRDNLRRLRLCFGWAYQNRHTPIDLRSWVEMPPAVPKPPKRLSAELLPALFTQADQTPDPDRTKAILSFLTDTGARRAEAAALLIQNLEMDKNGGMAFLHKTKFDKPRYVVFGETCSHYLTIFLDGVNWRKGQADQRVFGVTNQTIYRAVRDVSELAGLRHLIKGPHDLRRLFATHWTRQQPGTGYGQLLSKQLGHSSYSVTEMYTKLDIEDVRAGYISPLTGIVD